MIKAMYLPELTNYTTQFMLHNTTERNNAFWYRQPIPASTTHSGMAQLKCITYVSKQCETVLPITYLILF